MSKDVKMSKRCQISNSQATKLGKRFTKKLLHTMRFTNNHVNFDVMRESYQNWSKIYFMDILRIFEDHHVCDIEIDIIMCKPHCTKLFFCKNLHSQVI